MPDLIRMIVIASGVERQRTEMQCRLSRGGKTFLYLHNASVSRDNVIGVG